MSAAREEAAEARLDGRELTMLGRLTEGVVKVLLTTELDPPAGDTNEKVAVIKVPEET